MQTGATSLYGFPFQYPILPSDFPILKFLYYTHVYLHDVCNNVAFNKWTLCIFMLIYIFACILTFHIHSQSEKEHEQGRCEKFRKNFKSILGQSKRKKLSLNGVHTGRFKNSFSHKRSLAHIACLDNTSEKVFQDISTKKFEEEIYIHYTTTCTFHKPTHVKPKMLLHTLHTTQFL